MRLMRLLAGGLACLVLLAAATARAEAPPDPLRLVPEEADVVVELTQPVKLLQGALAQDQVKQWQQFQIVQDYLHSTNIRRFYQLVSYYEKELGAKWPELLDRLAGGGSALAIKFGPDPMPALLVIQGKDEKLVHKVAQLGLQLIEQSVSSGDAKNGIDKGSYRKIEIVHIGKDFHAAVFGSALVVTNLEAALHKAIDLHLDGPAKSVLRHATVAESRKLLPPDPLARVWLNLETVHGLPGAKDVFATPRNDANLTVLFGGMLDVAGRAPYVCAGLYQTKNGYLTTIRMPRGREGMGEGLRVHVPPADQPGARPLLEPRGVMYSSSFYLDLGKFWEDRSKLFNDKVAKSFEEFDKNSGRFLVGKRLSTLLTQMGAYHRVVVASQVKTGYTVVAKQPIPAFAFISEAREPEEFARSMETILRGVGLLVGFQYKLKLVEEKQGNHKIIGYRFPEDGAYPGDDDNYRFNFSPCFVAVGKQFVFCSTLELAHELVGLLEKEEASPSSRGTASAVRTQLYSSGGAAFLKTTEDVLVTQAILAQALEPAEAKKQVALLLDWLQHAGLVRIDSGYGATDWHFDIQLILGK